MKKSISQRLKEAREALELKVPEFAVAANVSLNTIYNYEADPDYQVSKKVLNAICLAHNINSNWVKNGIGEMQIETSESELSSDVNWKDEAYQAKEETILSMRSQIDQLQDEVKRVWALVTHFSGGKIPDFLKAIEGAGSPSYHLPGAQYGQSLIAKPN
jgi:transcriptional regulator with XRE-family HTH domain